MQYEARVGLNVGIHTVKYWLLESQCKCSARKDACFNADDKYAFEFYYGGKTLLTWTVPNANLEALRR